MRHAARGRHGDAIVGRHETRRHEMLFATITKHAVLAIARLHINRERSTLPIFLAREKSVRPN